MLLTKDTALSLDAQIARFSVRTDSSPRDSPNSAQKTSTLRSPISGALREMRHGEPLKLCVGFIVTNLARPAERIVAFYNKRGTAEQ